jgi:hypothetical protein
MIRSLAVVSLGVLWTLGAVACASEDTGTVRFPGTGNFAGSGGPVGPGGSGGPGLPGGPGGSGGPGGGSGGVAGSGGGGPDCGRTVHEAERRQLDMYIMFDESASMIPWWIPVTEAVMGFVEDPRSAGIGVGIQFFGPGSQCDPNYYAQPRVAIAPLPGNAAAIRQAFPLPFGGTPTRPALEGAVMHARSWSQSHPDSKVVVLLVTDGIPSDCLSTVDNSAEAARAGFSGTPSIPTYVIGIGNGLALDLIAQAGGTNRALTVLGTQDAVLEAMNQIRGQALPCDYALPANAPDKGRVNLELNVNGNLTTVPKVADANGCDPSRGGWYYNQDETRLVACPTTCSEFNNATAGSRVDVVLGCPTVILH